MANERFSSGDHVLWYGHEYIVRQADSSMVMAMRVSDDLALFESPRMLADHQRPWEFNVEEDLLWVPLPRSEEENGFPALALRILRDQTRLPMNIVRGYGGRRPKDIHDGE